MLFQSCEPWWGGGGVVVGDGEDEGVAANEIFADLSKSCPEQICVNDNKTLNCVLSAKPESETCLYGYDWRLIRWHGRRSRCTTLS